MSLQTDFVRCKAEEFDALSELKSCFPKRWGGKNES